VWDARRRDKASLDGLLLPRPEVAFLKAFASMGYVRLLLLGVSQRNDYERKILCKKKPAD
jgi:hypothetical protein